MYEFRGSTILDVPPAVRFWYRIGVWLMLGALLSGAALLGVVAGTVAENGGREGFTSLWGLPLSVVACIPALFASGMLGCFVRGSGIASRWIRANRGIDVTRFRFFLATWLEAVIYTGASVTKSEEDKDKRGVSDAND